ncbi:MAG: helix-turn-helix domain-containing protein [Acetobacteraceae bacterium]|nr:helix-turn-helix domain-containing protein [Acetobacteraceae bacterium]MBV8578742.1 helix-turn-helix domain-containing protein [Acetobacteraceae bacterium]
MNAFLQPGFQIPSASSFPIAAFGTQCTGHDLLAPLAASSVILRANREQQIFAQGDPADYCYRILSGCVRTVSLMEDGRRQVSEFLLRGDLLGWDAVDEYDVSAEAVTPVILRRCRRRSIEALADANVEVARRLRTLSAGKLRAARERMVLLGRKTAAERIASFLIEMTQRTRTTEIPLPMTRADIADHLGLTIETVCRGLAQLQREGTIKLRRGNVAIRDQRALGLASYRAIH